MNNKITKDIIPEGFTISLALFDLVPVFLFGASMLLIGIFSRSLLILLGAAICILSGVIKVIWKLTVAVCHQNNWWMFIQMRIAMPIGFILMIIGLIINGAGKVIIMDIFANIPSMIFFIMCIIGFVTMFLCMFVLDSSDKKSNWIEQTVNSITNLSFLISILLMLFM